MTEINKYTCPSCGYRVFDDSPGSLELCPICYWQDDLIDLEQMYEPAGPNQVSLEESQINYEKYGAIEERFIKYVRKPTKDDKKESSWRKLNRKVDQPRELPAESDNKENLYYWLWNNGDRSNN